MTALIILSLCVLLVGCQAEATYTLVSGAFVCLDKTDPPDGDCSDDEDEKVYHEDLKVSFPNLTREQCKEVKNKLQQKSVDYVECIKEVDKR